MLVSSKINHATLLMWLIFCGSSGYDGKFSLRYGIALVIISIFDSTPCNVNYVVSLWGS